MLSRFSEVNYVLSTQRDFHLQEERNALEIQVNGSTDFLARNIFSETTQKKMGFWGILKRILVAIANLLLHTTIEYEVGQR